MQAIIDIGSNTIRMLLANCDNGIIQNHSYYRDITRLAGGLSDQHGLSESSMLNSLAVLNKYKNILSQHDVKQLRVIGTAALRRAKNKHHFIESLFSETGLSLEVINGDEEALLTAKGVLSVIQPIPESAIIIDIGGGSTELAFAHNGDITFQESYPLGVVNLSEEFSSYSDRQNRIDSVFKNVEESIKSVKVPFILIGTAGTISTLGAIHLELDSYDARKINNHELSVTWLMSLEQRLQALSVREREAMTGMEKGRGDLILPGLQILLTMTRKLQLSSIKISDSGLLEGAILSLTDS